MTQDKEIIYVNGDSFTAGDDLGDRILPNYPAEKSVNDYLNNFDVDAHLNYQNWRSDYYKINNYGPWLKLEYENRWSTYLSQIIGKTIINNSYPGSDNFSIFARTCNDIEKLKSAGHIIKKVIIQITGFMRYSYVRHCDYSSDLQFELDIKNLKKLELNDGFFLRHIMPIQMDSERVTKKENEFLKRSYYEEIIYDDQPLETKLIGNLLQLKMYKDAVKGVAGVEPIILDSLFMKCFLTYTGTEKFIADKNSYAGKLFKDIFSDQFISMADIPDINEKCMTGGSHFNASVHERFAKKLAERFFNE